MSYITLALFELFLALKQHRFIEQKHKQLGITETRGQAAKRLNADLSISGAYFAWFPKLATRDFPPGTWPNKRVIGFNDGYGFPVHTTDRYGFFNADVWWDAPIDVIICGDSFATCEHLRIEDSLVSILRERGIRAINLGVTGCGPYISLAALKTYFPDPGKRLILWLYYEGNDLQDALAEYKVKTIRNSVTEYQHQSNFDRLNSIESTKLFDWRYKLSSWLTLKRLRYALSAVFDYSSHVKAFNIPMRELNRMTTNVVFVRIPRNNGQPPLDKILDKIKIKTKFTPVFVKEDYAFGLDQTHLTRLGYEKIANLISK
jgi:hypothetical protein